MLLRDLRKERKMSLKHVANRTGLSVSLYNGHYCPNHRKGKISKVVFVDIRNLHEVFQ